MFSNYEEYCTLFDTFSHPMRIKIIGILLKEKQYVSELSRMLNISRPLLYMHLKKLEGAKLIVGHVEISTSGKVLKYYEAIPFDMNLNSELLMKLAETIEINLTKDN